MLVALGAVGFLIWKPPTTIIGWLRSTPNLPRPAETRDTGARPKIADRIGGPSSSPGAEEGTPVAQKVVLYEEDPNDPAGKRYVGSAVWRTEPVPPAPGQPPDLAVRADIEIPERKISTRWSLRRNDDKALPASHTVEIMFTLPPDFPHGGISNIPGVLMKQAEQTRGVPLAGLAVKVTNNFFLIGLSSVDADMQRNIQLLKERSWFDIPIVYNDGRRAIIAIEKGTPGERAFARRLRGLGAVMLDADAGRCRGGCASHAGYCASPAAPQAAAGGVALNAPASAAPPRRQRGPAALPWRRRGSSPPSAPSRRRAPRSGARARARRRIRRRDPRA